MRVYTYINKYINS